MILFQRVERVHREDGREDEHRNDPEPSGVHALLGPPGRRGILVIAVFIVVVFVHHLLLSHLRLCFVLQTSGRAKKFHDPIIANSRRMCYTGVHMNFMRGYSHDR